MHVAETGCPDSFIYVHSENLCYYVVEMNLQWQSASQYCRAMDSRAHLVVINSADEMEIVGRGLSMESNTGILPSFYLPVNSTKSAGS